MRIRTSMSRMGGFMGFGGAGMFRRGKAISLSFTMGNDKVTLNQSKAQQSNPYGNNGYPARNAFKGGNSFTHTRRGKGEFWKAPFVGGD
jgi:hypothetical protein